MRVTGYKAITKCDHYSAYGIPIYKWLKRVKRYELGKVLSDEILVLYCT
jgi:hypothetical protein